MPGSYLLNHPRATQSHKIADEDNRWLAANTRQNSRHGLARAIRRMIRNKEGLINQYMSDCLLTYYKRKVHNMKKKRTF